MNIKTFEEKLQLYGSKFCCICGEPFTKENPCWNDNGCSADNKLHLDGECKACVDKSKQK